MRTIAHIRIGCLLFLFAFGASPPGVAGSCESMATISPDFWTDTDSLEYSISQTAQQQAFGGTAVSSVANYGCPANESWSIAGSLISGNFTYVATYLGSNQSCNSFTAVGTISGTGCLEADGTATNAATNQTFPISLNHACYIPTGESVPSFLQWGDPGVYDSGTAAEFNQEPLPNSYDWGGRNVTEQFLTQGTDSCYFNGSPYPPFVSNPPASAPIGGSDNGYADLVGWYPYEVLFYQYWRKAPCAATLHQTVYMDCPSGLKYYKSNTLIAKINPANVVSQRGATASPPLPFASQVQVNLISYLIFVWPQ